jgi:hypothetical protein
VTDPRTEQIAEPPPLAGTEQAMNETRIDFVPQTYPLYVPVMSRLPWLPPNEGEGIWQAELSELTDEALADEIMNPSAGGANRTGHGD